MQTLINNLRSVLVASLVVTFLLIGYYHAGANAAISGVAVGTLALLGLMMLIPVVVKRRYGKQKKDAANPAQARRLPGAQHK